MFIFSAKVMLSLMKGMLRPLFFLHKGMRTIYTICLMCTLCVCGVCMCACRCAGVHVHECMSACVHVCVGTNMQLQASILPDFPPFQTSLSPEAHPGSPPALKAT